MTVVERLAFASRVAIYDPQRRRLRPEAVLRSDDVIYHGAVFRSPGAA
jgi:hypothetical protein